MVTHPGPAEPVRIQSVACRAHPLRLRLRADVSLDRAISDAVRGAEFGAAWLSLQDLPCQRIAYVIPAPPPGDGRVAFYSDTRVLMPMGRRFPRIVVAGMHLGDGQAIHAHGLWRDATDTVQMGHLRAEGTYLANDAEVIGWGLDGAAFHRAPDPETGFDLFTPRVTPTARPGGLPAQLLRLRPHVELADALVGIADPQTRVMGLGSLIGTSFADAPAVPGPATEILVLDHDMPRLRIASVGADGAVSQGWLSGKNPVCVTAELLLVGH